MAKRAAQGAGSIRKKTVIRKGKEYTYWEARITTGREYRRLRHTTENDRGPMAGHLDG